jgi:hypothetical protein
MSECTTDAGCMHTLSCVCKLLTPVTLLLLVLCAAVFKNGAVQAGSGAATLTAAGFGAVLMLVLG